MALSNEAGGEWGEIRERYIENGFPPFKTWWFPSGSSEVTRELEAVRLIEAKGPAQYRLTTEGLDAILREVPMTSEASDRLDGIAQEYVEKNFPPFNSYNFACEHDKTVSELVARGFIDFPYLGRGIFRLTDHGQRWVMAQR